MRGGEKLKVGDIVQQKVDETIKNLVLLCNNNAFGQVNNVENGKVDITFRNGIKPSQMGKETILKNVPENLLEKD